MFKTEYNMKNYLDVILNVELKGKLVIYCKIPLISRKCKLYNHNTVESSYDLPLCCTVYERKLKISRY